MPCYKGDWPLWRMITPMFTRRREITRLFSQKSSHPKPWLYQYDPCETHFQALRPQMSRQCDYVVYMPLPVADLQDSSQCHLQSSVKILPLFSCVEASGSVVQHFRHSSPGSVLGQHRHGKQREQYIRFLITNAYASFTCYYCSCCANE